MVDQNNSDSESGFSVLEAIIAMALLSVALLPMLALQSQFVDTALAVERAEVRISTRQNAANYLKSINFDQAPRGELDLGSRQLFWYATPISPPRNSWNSEIDPARYRLTLYQVAITVQNEEQVVTDQFNLEGLGWSALWPSVN